MTRNDNLFDIQYVKFDVTQSQGLIGKNVFVSNSLILLRDAVNEVRTDNGCYYGKLLSIKDYTTHAAFNIDSDGRIFSFVYYDPYYELKCALKRGETIEHMYSDGCWRTVTDPEFSDEPKYYRIKSNKPALKWQELKIGDIIRGPLMKGIKYETGNDYYGMVTLIDTDKGTNAHICMGNQWVMDEDICKFRRVNEHGEDIE